MEFIFKDTFTYFRKGQRKRKRHGKREVIHLTFILEMFTA